MDPALGELYADGAPEDEVAVILRVVDRRAVPGYVRVVADFGTIVTCRMQRADLLRVRLAPGVLSTKAARRYGPTLPREQAYPADTAAQSSPPPTGLTAISSDPRRSAEQTQTGRGVIVAHIDWGLDFAHPDFRHPDGRTRVLALWDQTCPYDARYPNPSKLGRVYRSAEIDRALATSNPYRALGYDPAESDSGRGTHGTHTMSIAAGSGSAERPSGVAPHAGLVFVQFATTLPNAPALLGDSVTFLEALTFVASVAQGRCFVINASLGRHAGEHDGWTLTEQAMDHFLLAAPGRAIVQSCGNYFDRGIHTSGVVRPGQTERRRMLVEEGDRTPNELDLWYPGADRFLVTVRGPAGVCEVSVRGDEQAVVMADGRSLGRLYHRLGDPNNGDNQVTLFLYRGAPAGEWEIELFGQDVVDGRFHAWVERDAACAGCQARFAPEDRDPSGTLGTICNGLRTLAVGAYDAHDPQRPLARFSSAGRTRDGREKPDLVAPGVAILAARSRPRTASGGPALLTRMSGTSMSAPHVTGTIALMFEAAGRPLRIEETRSLLLGQCDPSESTVELDQHRYGSGYLNTDAAVAATLRAARCPLFASRSVHATTPEIHPLGTDWRHLLMNPNNSANSSFGAAPERDAEARSDERGTRHGMTSRSQPSPFQFQIPLTGGPPALGFPIGGPGSPLGFSIPLGAASPQAAAPTPVPGAATSGTSPLAVGAASPLGAAATRVGSELEPVSVATAEPLYVPPAPEWMEAEEYELALERSGASQSEPTCGQRTLAAAESLIAAGSNARRLPSSALLRALFHGQNAAAMLARAAHEPIGSLASHGAAPSATALFRVLGSPRASAGRRGAIQRLYGARYAVLARPGDPLSNIAPAPGDLLLRVARGEGWGHVAVVASPVMFAHEQLASLGLRPEGAPLRLPGHYLHVVELGHVPRMASERFVRRLCDAAGVVLPDTLWLRPIDPQIGGSGERGRAIDTTLGNTRRAALDVGACALREERLGEDAGAPAGSLPAGRLVVPEVPLLRAHQNLTDGNESLADDPHSAATNRHSRAYIAWVQASLNAITHAGLVVDGISGARTRAAVRAFQQSHALTQDGIVGPQTEAALLASGVAPASDPPTPVPQVTPATPPPPPAPTPPRSPASDASISEAFVRAVTPVQLANTANINDYFRQRSGVEFVDWFNARVAGTGLWSRLRLEPAGNPETAKARFRQIWDRIPELFGTPTINLFQFFSLLSIIVNETGGQMLPVSERVGRPGHPGIAYAFDRIPGTKHSYNAGGNRTALQLFNDREFLSAHGSLPLAARVRETTDSRWGGDVYPQGDFPTSTDPNISGILLQADFYKFRGRGLIQTTFRDAYRRVIAHIQNHAPSQAIVADYSRQWAGRSPESIATTSTNEDWNRLYQETDLWVAAASVHLHSQGKRNYLNLPLDAGTLNGRQNGSIWNVGRQVSGSERYADLLRGRVLQMIGALAPALERPTEQEVG